MTDIWEVCRDIGHIGGMACWTNVGANNLIGLQGIWANQPIHSFLIGCLNPCLQETSVRVVLPQPSQWGLDFSLLEMEFVSNEDNGGEPATMLGVAW